MNGRSLYLVDFSNWRIKFECVRNTHVSRNGVDISTASISGFAQQLRSLPFDDILIVLDGVPQNSLNILPTYKGTRNGEADGSLKVSKAEEVQFLTKLGEMVGKTITVVCSPLQETDQVISSIVYYITHNLPEKWKLMSMLNNKSIEDDRRLARFMPVQTTPLPTYYLDQFDSVVIASTDADFCQLLRFPGVYIDTSTSGSLITDERITDSTSKLPPIQTILYKCIVGDGADNVPKLPLKNWKLINEIIATVDTMDKLNEFFNIVSGTSATPTVLPIPAVKLAEFINRYCKKQFDINKEVTFCQFVSLPQMLNYPDYDIETTIANYKLKV